VFPVRGPLAPLRGVLDLGARALPRLASTEFERVRADRWSAEVVRPRGGATSHGAILYFHGGAFVSCGMATHRRIVERLALRTGLLVMSVSYRQFGEALVETSIEDCVGALSWMVGQGVDPAEVVLAGDSAGGHLAFAVALAGVRAGVHVGGIVALSPWLDFDCTIHRSHENARTDHLLPARRMMRVARQVNGTRVIEPLRSPVNAALSGLPPSLLMCAADEVLRHDAELMTERLEAAGVPVDLHIWEGQVHAFPVLAHLLPESRRALDLIGEFVVDTLAAGSPEDAELAS
jgi:acetyl esterase/lipase